MNNSEIFDTERKKIGNVRVNKRQNSLKVMTENNQDNVFNNDLYTGIKDNNFVGNLEDTVFENDFNMNIDQRKKKLFELKDISPKIVLEVVNKINLPLGSKIYINTIGIENSVRNEKDGITYFGCLSNNEDNKVIFCLSKILMTFYLNYQSKITKKDVTEDIFKLDIIFCLINIS